MPRVPSGPRRGPMHATCGGWTRWGSAIERNTRPRVPRAGVPSQRDWTWLEIHPAHASHAAARWHRRHRRLRLGLLGHHGFGRDQQAGDRRRVLQRMPHDFRRIDDAGLDEVGELALLGIVAVVDVRAVQELADHDRAVGAGVLGDLPSRPLEGLADDVDTDLLVRIGRGQLVERLDRIEQRDTATGDDTLFDRRTGRMHRVVDAVLALFHLNVGRAADPDDHNPAGELRQPLLQLLAVIVGGGFLDLLPNLGDATIDVGLLPAAVDDRRVLLLDSHLLGLAEHVERHVLELDAEILASGRSRGAKPDPELTSYSDHPLEAGH